MHRLRNHSVTLLFMLSLMSLFVLPVSAGLVEENHLEKLYETSSDSYRCLYLTDASAGAELTEETKEAMDCAVDNTNILRIYAGSTNYSSLSDEQQDKYMKRYIKETGFSDAEPLFVFYRDSSMIQAFTSTGFDKLYGEDAGNDIEALVYELYSDVSNCSMETKLLFAAADYFDGVRPSRNTTENPESDTEEAGNVLADLQEEYPDFFAEQEESSGKYLAYKNEETSYEAIIQDDASLILDSEYEQVLEAMKPLTEYENVIFATTDYNMYASDSENRYCQELGDAKFSKNAKYSVFLIDMDNRQIYIYSSKSMYKIITTSKALMITDNIYRLAANEKYADCAMKAFEQMGMVLDGRRLFSIMKLISNLLLSIVFGLTVCWGIMAFALPNKRTSFEDIVRGMGYRNSQVYGTRRKLISSRFVKDSDSSGGGSSGGGGGGSSGGGGGGGHGF